MTSPSEADEPAGVVDRHPPTRGCRRRRRARRRLCRHGDRSSGGSDIFRPSKTVTVAHPLSERARAPGRSSRRRGRGHARPASVTGAPACTHASRNAASDRAHRPTRRPAVEISTATPEAPIASAARCGARPTARRTVVGRRSSRGQMGKPPPSRRWQARKRVRVALPDVVHEHHVPGARRHVNRHRRASAPSRAESHGYGSSSSTSRSGGCRHNPPRYRA